jgi:Zn finger protein HypA/HybF involved in hydrogenase expression
MYTEISAAIASTKTALEIIKSANGLANYGELVAAVSEVSTKLMDATAVALASQEKQGVLIARVAELERELANLNEVKKKQSRYKLHEFSTGTFAYALKEDCADGEPHHYLCAACMDKECSTKMQPVGNKRQLWCPECKTALQIEPVPPSPIRQRQVSNPRLW